ncbi:MAG: hypothetical protein HQM08_21655 [Candidatus Riflebacteria bacterium]|nr:hypothetical protein [Candidatus Riflebacteria bacterium]
MNRKFHFFMEKKDPVITYAIEFVFMILGIPIQISEKAKPDIVTKVYYGNNCPDPEKFQLIFRQNPNELVWKELLNDSLKLDSVGKIVEFDVFASIAALLCDEVHSSKDIGYFDEHARLLFHKSFQFENGFEKIPLINVYISILKELFLKKFKLSGVPLWPNGKKWAVALSHDVDNPEKYPAKFFPFLSKGKALKENLKFTYRKLYDSFFSVLDNKRNEYWQFEDITTVEKSYGFNSAFYFSSASRRDVYASNFDVEYSIFKNPAYLKLFCFLQENNFEIGLHASYNAYKERERIFEEKEKLESLTGGKIQGNRHHLWHLGNDETNTFEIHEAAGFKYDTSISFNENIAFRRNLALPFQVWSKKLNRALKLWEFPVFCMDAHLVDYFPSPSSAVEKAIEYIENIRKFEGLGVIDWHVRTSFPGNDRFLNWGQTYVSLLKKLSQYKDAWITSPASIYEWLTKRTQNLYSETSGFEN